MALAVRILPVVYGAIWTDLYARQAVPVLEHLNIYSATRQIFPYSPVSMFLPALCAKLSFAINVPFHIVMKMPCVIADVCIALSIYLVMIRKEQKNAFRWGLFYALNPLSILISSFHGNVISISTLLTFLAYTVLLFGIERNYRLSALILGLAIGFRSYPVLLLPLFLIKLHIPLRKKFEYALYATVPTVISFIPFLILDYKSVIREAFGYSGFPDYGLVAILRAIRSFRADALLYHLPDDLHLVLHDITKILFLVVYVIILIAAARKNLIVLIISVFLMFYFVYAGISSQYFIWILPFAFLNKDKLLKYYLLLSTLALVNFYWLYHPHIIFGRLEPPNVNLSILLFGEIVSLSLLWVFCLFWAVKLLTGKTEPKEYTLV